MAKTLYAHLSSLSADDLSTLLQRRPEARRLLGERVPPSWTALAEAVSRTDGLRLCVASLSGFHLQLLQLGLWLGSPASDTALAQEAMEVSPASLRAGAEELARWGLAFPVEREEDAPPSNGQAGSKQKKRRAAPWQLEIPPATAAIVSMPGGFGPLGRRLLAGRPVGFLSAVAGCLGLPSQPRRGADAFAAEIAGFLAQPDNVAQLLADAPPKARVLFDKIRDEGGTAGRHELMTAGHIRWSDPPWTERRMIVTPMDWLESRALVLYDAAITYNGLMVIPAEVELALRGGRIFTSWPPAAPPPLALPEGGSPAPSGASDPAKILAELSAALEEWATTRPVELAKGGLGVRELRRTSKALGFDERYVGFLYALAVQAGLIGTDPDRRVVPGPEAEAWSSLPAPERWARLFESWRHSLLWSEEDGLVPVDKLVGHLWVDRLRSGVLADLASLPPAGRTDAKLLGARVYWRSPRLFHCEDCAQSLAARVVEALQWLGTASGTAALALLEPGRSAAEDPQWFARPGPATAAFAAEVATCTVGADLTIIVPGPPVHELGQALGRFAELKASSPARVYRLSEASLRRAMDDGMRPADILGTLERHASRGVPQNVSYLIEDVGRRHGNLIGGEAGLYLRSEDPALLRGAIADRRLAAFRPRIIAPTVAILHGESVTALLAALRAAGYLPVAEDAEGALVGAAPVTQVAPIVHLNRSTGPLSAREAGQLAAALRTSPARPAPPPSEPAYLPKEMLRRLGGKMTTPRTIADLVTAALQTGMVLEIGYLSQSMAATTREVEPIDLFKGKLIAWCRLRDEERDFRLDSIVWARATGELLAEPALPGEDHQ